MTLRDHLIETARTAVGGEADEIATAKHNYRSLVRECGEIERQIHELAEQLEGVLEDRLAAAEYLRELGAWGEFEVAS